MAEGLNPQTVNHLRSFLSRAFNRAIEVGRRAGDNPVSEVKKRRVPKSVASDYLRSLEVPPVLHDVPPDTCFGQPRSVAVTRSARYQDFAAAEPRGATGRDLQATARRDSP
jgi:hypothetical protein